MENENPKQDCGCSPGCCQPPENNNIWSKLIFAIIMLAAVIIVTIKLTTKEESQPAIAADTVNTGCADKKDSSSNSPCTKVCSPSENSSCCPKSKE
jgi:hypothetical protein